MISSSLAAVAHDPVGPPIPFDNSYARLPEAFYERVHPVPVAAPQLLRLNEALDQELRIDPEFLKSSQGVEILAGNAIAPGSEPIALAYAGHQFGHFVPQLGDGRAVLLGEVLSVAGATISCSRGPGQRGSRAEVTVAPRWGPWCGNTSSAKPWPRSGFPLPDH